MTRYSRSRPWRLAIRRMAEDPDPFIPAKRLEAIRKREKRHALDRPPTPRPPIPLVAYASSADPRSVGQRLGLEAYYIVRRTASGGYLLLGKERARTGGLEEIAREIIRSPKPVLIEGAFDESLMRTALNHEGYATRPIRGRCA